MVTDSPLAAVAPTASPSFALLERLTSDQNALLLRVKARLPSHLQVVAFAPGGLRPLHRRVLALRINRSNRTAQYGPLPIAYISRATVDFERNWTLLNLEAGSIIWAIKRRRGFLLRH